MNKAFQGITDNVPMQLFKDYNNRHNKLHGRMGSINQCFPLNIPQSFCLSCSSCSVFGLINKTGYYAFESMVSYCVILFQDMAGIKPRNSGTMAPRPRFFRAAKESSERNYLNTGHHSQTSSMFKLKQH